MELLKNIEIITLLTSAMILVTFILSESNGAKGGELGECSVTTKKVLMESIQKKPAFKGGVS